MLDPRVRGAAERLLPRLLLRALDPFESCPHEALAEFAAALPANSRVLDAGAGECRYAPLFARHCYVSLDSAVGDPAWNYSQLHVLGDLEQIAGGQRRLRRGGQRGGAGTHPRAPARAA